MRSPLSLSHFLHPAFWISMYSHRPLCGLLIYLRLDLFDPGLFSISLSPITLFYPQSSLFHFHMALGWHTVFNWIQKEGDLFGLLWISWPRDWRASHFPLVCTEGQDFYDMLLLETKGSSNSSMMVSEQFLMAETPNPFLSLFSFPFFSFSCFWNRVSTHKLLLEGEENSILESLDSSLSSSMQGITWNGSDIMYNPLWKQWNQGMSRLGQGKFM